MHLSIIFGSPHWLRCGYFLSFIHVTVLIRLEIRNALWKVRGSSFVDSNFFCLCLALISTKVSFVFKNYHVCCSQLNWDELTCTYAAYGGHLSCLQYARENGCPWDKETCSSAALSEHLCCLKWARENSCPWDEDTCDSLSSNGWERTAVRGTKWRSDLSLHLKLVATMLCSHRERKNRLVNRITSKER